MDRYHLKYEEGSIAKMKKNSKSCIRLLYNIRARSWKDTMLNFIKDKLHLSLSVTAPKELQSTEKRYRKDPNTFL